MWDKETNITIQLENIFAETWWSENRDKVYERYNVRSTDKSANQAARSSEGAVSPVSQT